MARRVWALAWGVLAQGDAPLHLAGQSASDLQGDKERIAHVHLALLAPAVGIAQVPGLATAGAHLQHQALASQVKQVDLAHAGWAQHPPDLGGAQVNPRHKPGSPANGGVRI